MTPQQKLFADIRQVKLKPRMMELLRDGITRATIMQCLHEYKEDKQEKPGKHCPRKARAALIAARHDI